MVVGLRGIFGARIAALVSLLLNTFGLQVASTLITNGSFIDAWFHFTTIAWLLVDVALLVTAMPFARAQRGTPAEPLALAFVSLTGVGLGLTVIAAVSQLAGLKLFTLASSMTMPYFLLERAAFAATEVCFWLTLEACGVAPRSWRPVLFGILAFSLGLSLLRIFQSPAEHRETIGTTLGAALAWLRAGLSAAEQSLFLIVLWRGLQQTAAGATRTPRETPHGEVIDEANGRGRDIAIGALWLLGGCAITFGSYASASSGSGGGRYLISIGPILYGLVRIIRGLARL